MNKKYDVIVQTLVNEIKLTIFQFSFYKMTPTHTHANCLQMYVIINSKRSLLLNM